jgi:hypothetical protein
MKMKFGALVVAGSGKIGGHVAARNRSGAYLRTKVTPVNPQTASQAGARNRLSGLSSGWRALTAAQRAAWNGAVQDFSKTDVFGDLRNPSGFNLYQRLNNNLINVGEAALTLPPQAVQVDAFTSVSLTAADNTVAEAMSLTYAPAIEADHQVKVFATAPLSAGVSFVKSEYRQIDVIATADASPLNLLAAYQAKFGSTGAAGGKIFVKLVQVNTTSGQEGTPVSASAIVSVSA